MKKASPTDIAKMDSLKIPKGSTGKPSAGSVPITVRFNAGEESLDDIFQSFQSSATGGSGSAGGGDSLSSSPQQHNPDELNTRNNFLQGNFFNRKRSGSVEGPQLISTGTLNTLSGSDINTLGTWKLIKGKVSQAMEDIKSSKSNNTLTIKGDEQDSDVENATVNSSISDELSLEQEYKATTKCDSETDVEQDILLEGDVERSRIRRSIANLKSKVKARSQVPTISTTKSSLLTYHSSNRDPSIKKDPSPSRAMSTQSAILVGAAAAPTTSIRSSFLRKRKKPIVDGAEAALPATAGLATPHPIKEKKGIISGKRDIEVESGVEMLEDMVPTQTSTGDISKLEITDVDSKNIDRGSLKLSLETNPNENEKLQDPPSKIPSNSKEEIQKNEANIYKSGILNFINLYIKSIPFMLLVALLGVLWIPSIPDFLRGVFFCLLLMAIFNSVWNYLQQLLINRITSNGPERTKFKIPNYKEMSICEIPAVEEHKTVKTYTGWMNEIHSYDPANFHISMTKSVYIKLDGSILRVSNTTARVPKRQMWNEPVIDRKSITFTQHRTFNLLGCRIEMLPRGLARKRYFSRKYPLQLIIKNADGQKIDENTAQQTSKEDKPIKRPSSSKSLDEKIFDSKSNKDSTLSIRGIPHQNSSDSIEDRSERSNMLETESDLDFATTILNADLQSLQENIPDTEIPEVTVPCGDETRILLFARGDREKEDWFRRFVAASAGNINDQDLHIPNIVMVSEAELKAAAKTQSVFIDNSKNKGEMTPSKSMTNSFTEDSKNSETQRSLEKPERADKSVKKQSQEGKERTPDFDLQEEKKTNTNFIASPNEDTFEGLLISTCAARNSLEYIRFMARYQNACNQSRIPVLKTPTLSTARIPRRLRREKRQEDELWKGIDQSLFLGPSGSVVWANVLIGRVLFSCLNDSMLLGKIQDFLQKKLSSIKLPSFMEDVSITQIYLGETPPLIHRVSQPFLDERGTWIDADLTYEGLMHMTITAKLNLLRLKRQHTKAGSSGEGPCININNGTSSIGSSPPKNPTETEIPTATDQLLDEVLTNCAIYDSDAESSGASSSETGSPTVGSLENNAMDNQFFNSSPGNARRLFKIVDRIAASNIFQYATELSYVQKAMENMSTNITLRVDLKGLVSRVTVNIPPPPTDRIWLAFRGPPRLWVSATPTVGDHTFDWSIVTNVIESKLCEEAYKYLVYPNMIDVIVPFLGQSTYRE